MRHAAAAARVVDRPTDTFSDRDIEGLPVPVRRYFSAAIAPGTPIAGAVNLHMRGSIKLGTRWLPFRARQVLAPHDGGVWSARVAGVISGSDRYTDGQGEMSWKLFGLIPLMHAAGADISRSAAGRFGAEAMWVPTTLLPSFGVSWSVESDEEIVAHHRIHDVKLTLRFRLDHDGLIRSMWFPRWGDPDSTGTSALHPFGVEVTANGTFAGLTIPRAGRGGWFHGTDRWDEGEFFRYDITRLQPTP